MLVDPFTVVAQVVNFLILVAALKFLLYDRITAAMDARQERIAEEFARAEQREAEADRSARHHDEELARLRRERRHRLQHVEEEARERREELVARARRDVAALEEQWLDAVRQERERLLDELRRGTTDRVMDITRRVLVDLADEQLEDRILRVFVDRLAATDPALLPDLDGVEVDVRTSFELDGRQRRRLDEAVRTHLDGVAGVRFTAAPELVGGVELDVDGHTLGWNIDAYLDDVETTVRRLVHEGA